MAYVILHDGDADADRAVRALRAGLWPVAADEPHRDRLAPDDRALVLLGPPRSVFVGRAVLASGVRRWTDDERDRCPYGAADGVTLTAVEEWDPPAAMADVLARIDRSGGARATFSTGVVLITEPEYEAAVAVAGGR